MSDKKANLPESESGLDKITVSIHNVSIVEASISDDNEEISFGTTDNVIDGQKCYNCQLIIPNIYLNEHLSICLLGHDKPTKRRTEVCSFKYYYNYLLLKEILFINFL